MTQQQAVAEDVRECCFRITASFEGRELPGGFGNLTGNFDGQGLSWGFLQFAMKAGSLPEIWRACLARDRKRCSEVLGDLYEPWKTVLRLPGEEQVEWAIHICEKPRSRKIREAWNSRLRELGLAFGDVQREFADRRLNLAALYCDRFKLTTDRSLAGFFDLVVQQGSLFPQAKKLQVEAKIQEVTTEVTKRTGGNLTEADRLEIPLRARALTAAAAWVDDCLSRRMTIIHGTGKVHGKVYNLGQEYGLLGKPWRATGPQSASPGSAGASPADPLPTTPGLGQLPDWWV